mgnify:CR=1 FL=1
MISSSTGKLRKKNCFGPISSLFSLSTAKLRKIRGKNECKNWWQKLVKTSDGYVICTSFSWWGQVWWKWHTVLVCVLWSWHLLWHAPLIISPSHSQGSDRQPLQQPDHSVRFDQFYFTYQDVMSISENVRLFFCYGPQYIVIDLGQLSESAHFFILNSTRISCQLST